MTTLFICHQHGFGLAATLMTVHAGVAGRPGRAAVAEELIGAIFNESDRVIDLSPATLVQAVLDYSLGFALGLGRRESAIKIRRRCRV